MPAATHPTLPMHCLALRRGAGFLACRTLLVCSTIIVAAAAQSLFANPALDGYSNHEQFTRAVEELDRSDLVSVSSLGKSLSGRDLVLLTLGTGKVHEKPGIVVIGNVQGSHLAGAELALRLARQLVAQADKEPKAKELLDRVTYYIMPRPDPDACEKCFTRPFREPAGNARRTDDDRDFEFGEDPPDDLNGDGWITQMRVADSAGTHVPHPDDPRILVPLDPKKNELGKYRIYTEGRDNDGDGQFNEDAGDGVAFNRNFPFRYAPFLKHGGANAASEPEVRALIDFLFDRPNIAAVFCFSPEDNLFFPWKPKPELDKGKRKGSVQGPDVTPFEFLSEQYKKIHSGKDAPETAAGPGSFTEWAYFNYGRWSLATRGWWIPKVEVKPEGDKKPSDEKRGADDLNALRWLAQEKLDGFADWQPIEHPDFPGKKVEVGGFKPFYRLNPPGKELDALAQKQLEYLLQLPARLPQIAIADAKAEKLGGGVVRITATAVNRGYLATMPEMGRINTEAYPLQIMLDVPKGTELLQNPVRMRVKRLEGLGGSEEKMWLVRFAGEPPASVKLKLWAPAVGSVETMVEVGK